MRTSEEERLRNRSVRTQMKKVIKDVHDTQNRTEAEGQLRQAFSVIDKASQFNIIHKNKAARDKSRLTAFVRKLSS